MASDWSNVNVVIGFNEAYGLSLPIVTIDDLSTRHRLKEIGNTSLLQRQDIIIDIFAKSHPMRQDLASYVIEKLADGCVYYTHSHASGDNTTIVRTSSGRIRLVSVLEDRKVEFGEDVDAHDRYRHKIHIVVENSQ